MAGGRPTSYLDTFPAFILDYADNFSRYGDKLPSIEGLACELGVALSTIYLWEKDENKTGFSESLSYLKHKQARTCLNNGLDGTFNAAITKLVLHNHGYSDKQEVDNKSTDGSMSPRIIRDNIPDESK